jgi:hypothetical protein
MGVVRPHIAPCASIRTRIQLKSKMASVILQVPLFYGKSGEIATNRLDDQELSVLSLHLLQSCLVYINTLMLQDILAEPEWMGRMTTEDFRALSPLVYMHVNPYGIFELDMDARLPLAA